MTAKISGSRNGEDWPPRGAVIDLPDAEAAEYCAAGLASPVTTFPEVERAVVPDEGVESRGGPVLTTANAFDPPPPPPAPVEVKPEPVEAKPEPAPVAVKPAPVAADAPHVLSRKK
jgi:hypothetical protein